jgi:hypothetical protein
VEWRRDLDAEIVFTFALSILWEKALTLSQTKFSDVSNALENMGREIPTILTRVFQLLESGGNVRGIECLGEYGGRDPDHTNSGIPAP